MSMQKLPQSAVRASEIEWVTTGVSDVSIASGSAVENETADTSESSTKLAKKKKSRADRRRVVKGKGKEVMQQQDDEDEAADVQDSASVASSSTLSAGTVATQIIDEPYQPGGSSQPRATTTTAPVLDTVPVLSHYEHRRVTGHVGDGIPRHGIFATQDIAAGTRIIYEAPLLALPAPSSNPTVLMPAFRGLNDQEQDMIYKLYPVRFTVTKDLTDMAAMIRQHLPRFHELNNTPAATITQAAKEEFEQLALELSEVCETFRVTARWEAHSQPISPLPSHNLLAADMPVSGLFPRAALLRHSCVPNTHKDYNCTTHKLSVQATQDVAAGQELTLSHLEDTYFADATTRQFHLQQQLSITCDCAACTGHYVAVHDTARLHARACREELWTIVAGLPGVDFQAYGADLRLDGDLRLHGFKATEAVIARLLGALRATGCLGPEPLRWLQALVTRVLPRAAQVLADAERIRAWKQILLHARRCVDIGVRCLGRDVEMVGKFEDMVKVIEGLVERAEERMRVLRESRERLGL